MFSLQGAVKTVTPVKCVFTTFLAAVLRRTFKQVGYQLFTIERLQNVIVLTTTK